MLALDVRTKISIGRSCGNLRLDATQPTHLCSFLPSQPGPSSHVIMSQHPTLPVIWHVTPWVASLHMRGDGSKWEKYQGTQKSMFAILENMFPTLKNTAWKTWNMGTYSWSIQKVTYSGINKTLLQQWKITTTTSYSLIDTGNWIILQHHFSKIITYATSEIDSCNITKWNVNHFFIDTKIPKF